MSIKDVHQKSSKTVSVIGAGLAGSECALQLADLGYSVVLYEMRGQTMTEAHQTDNCAELVCSNSFGSLSEGSAPAQLKWEAQQLHSHILKSALVAQVPAGQALGMDRKIFSETVTARIKNHPKIQIETKLITDLNQVPRPAVVATGPLTEPRLAKSLQDHFGGDFLYFLMPLRRLLTLTRSTSTSPGRQIVTTKEPPITSIAL
jgi:methylenetetrahydrofolate--tRNA-(uracil-5-)-methyltransferase